MFILRALCSLLLLLGVTALSHIPYGQEPQSGRLRLSWKTVGEGQKQAPAEVSEDVPVHMRNPNAAAVAYRDYQLSLRVDGQPVLERRFSPPGLHRDRPISVFEEVDLPPGNHQIELRYWPIPEEGAAWKPELKKSVAVEKGGIVVIGLDDLPPLEINR